VIQGLKEEKKDVSDVDETLIFQEAFHKYMKIQWNVILLILLDYFR